MFGRTIEEKAEDYLLLQQAKELKAKLEKMKKMIDLAEHKPTAVFLDERIKELSNAIDAFEKLEKLDESLRMEEEMLNNDK